MEASKQPTTQTLDLQTAIDWLKNQTPKTKLAALLLQRLLVIDGVIGNNLLDKFKEDVGNNLEESLQDSPESDCEYIKGVYVGLSSANC